MFENLATMEDALQFVADAPEPEVAEITAMEQLDFICCIEECMQCFEEYEENAAHLELIMELESDIRINDYTADTIARNAIALEGLGIDINRNNNADAVLAVLEEEKAGFGAKLKGVWDKIWGFIKRIFGFGEKSTEAAAADTDDAMADDAEANKAVEEAAAEDPNAATAVSDTMNSATKEEANRKAVQWKKKLARLWQKVKSMFGKAKDPAQQMKEAKEQQAKNHAEHAAAAAAQAEIELAQLNTSYLSRQDFTDAINGIRMFMEKFDGNAYTGKALPPDVMQVLDKLKNIKTVVGTPKGLGWRVNQLDNGAPGAKREFDKLKPSIDKVKQIEAKLNTLVTAAKGGNTDIDIKSVQAVLAGCASVFRVYQELSKTIVNLVKCKVEIVKKTTGKEVVTAKEKKSGKKKKGEAPAEKPKAQQPAQAQPQPAAQPAPAAPASK